MTHDEQSRRITRMTQNDDLRDAMQHVVDATHHKSRFDHHAFVRAAMFSLDTKTLETIMEHVRHCRGE